MPQLDPKHPDLLDRLQEGLSVSDLVWDAGQDTLEVGRLLVQLLEGVLCSGHPVVAR